MDADGTGTRSPGCESLSPHVKREVMALDGPHTRVNPAAEPAAGDDCSR